MATDPFTLAFVDRLTSQVQAYRLSLLTGRVVTFRFYCCDDPPNLGVTKPPAAVIDLEPDTQCTGVNITWDVSGSYSPLGTIDTYTITWGDGTTTGPVNWAVGPWTGNKSYANAGTYTIRLIITDTLGVSGTISYTVLIIACASESVLIEQMYALSQTAGPYVRDMTVAVPAWVQRIRGLTGNWLNGRDLKLDLHRKHLRYGLRHVWIATQSGPAKSTSDMLFWSRLYSKLPEPRNDAGDPIPPTKANLDWYCVSFNPQVRDTVYVLAGTATRSWVYYTINGGKTWDNWQVRF